MHTWGKSEVPARTKRGRILNVVALVIAVIVLYLALRKPQPLTAPQSPASIAANAQSFQAKIDQLAQAPAQGQSGGEVRLSADEISAAISQAASSPGSANPGAGSLPANGTFPNPDSSIAPGSVDGASLGEPIVSLDGDLLRGQLVTELAGKKLYITVAGHLGSQDGYATFQPTEFKVGDLKVPVSLVNEALQKKLLAERDRLKLPDFVSAVKVENGQLVVKEK